MLFNNLMIWLLFVGSRSLPQSDDKLCAATIYTNSTVVNVQYVWCLQVRCCPDGCIYRVTLLWYRLMLSVVWWCVSVTPVSLSLAISLPLPHLTSLSHGYLVMLFIFWRPVLLISKWPTCMKTDIHLPRGDPPIQSTVVPRWSSLISALSISPLYQIARCS